MHSSAGRTPVNADAMPQELWDDQLATMPQTASDWLWHGFLRGGSTTLLTGLWKAGKTTLLSLLLARRRQGGTLAGLAVKPGKTVVISEEDPALWAERARCHDFGGQVCFIPRPFLAVPRPEQWQALLDRLVTLRGQHGIDLAVIDPLAPFFRGENNARSIYETMMPLGALTRRGLAVLGLHHPGKGAARPGQAARGSGALLGHVDISIEMRHPGGDPLTRRRRFLALSRYPETPRQLLAELAPDGSDYVPVADEPFTDDFQANWDVLRMVLEDARQKLTRRDIHEEWPPDFPRPSPRTLWAWLGRAVDRGLVACEGTGRKTDPFRYWLPDREAVWKAANPFYEVLEQQRQQFGFPFQSLHEKKRVDRQAEAVDHLLEREAEDDD
jgi:hypothetical protein